MPEFTALHLAMLASLFAVGVGLGWLLRSDRCAREKIAINAGWQEQVETRQAENDRLTDQNRDLMKQISEHQASGQDSAARARDLSTSIKEALEQRDDLYRKLKDLRGSFNAAEQERASLQMEIEAREGRLAAGALALKEKDNKIFRLSRQLSSWQARVPPLVERYRERDRELQELRAQRDAEVQELEAKLDQAVNRIAELEVLTRPDVTSMRAVGDDALGRLDASNDQYGEHGEQEFGALQDQVVPWHEAPPLPEASGADRSLLDMDFSETSAAMSRASEDGRDDLKKIKGVGPAIERTLNELGIYRYEQITRISEYDIDRVASRLRGFRSRVYREDWIGQARSLQRQPQPDPDA